MESLNFTFETVDSYERAYASGRLFEESFNIARFVARTPNGGTNDFPVKSREDALKLAVMLPENGWELLRVYECEHQEEDKQEMYAYYD